MKTFLDLHFHIFCHSIIDDRTPLHKRKKNTKIKSKYSQKAGNAGFQMKYVLPKLGVNMIQRNIVFFLIYTGTPAAVPQNLTSSSLNDLSDKPEKDQVGQ